MPEACSSAQSRSELRLPSRAAALLACVLATGMPVARGQDPECPPSTSFADEEWQALIEADPLDQRIDLDTDKAEFSVDGDGHLQGNVRVRQGQREIRAEDVRYEGKSQRFEVEGSVEYRDPLVRVIGNDGTYSATEGANFNAAQFELRERGARGEAGTIELNPDGVIDLEKVTFTSCPAGEEAWRIRAGSITLNTRRRLGTGRHARVDFKGVPIVWLPRISFPLGSERKSGFLFPSVGHSSRGGAQLAVPYYWNIAPNADLTFEPTGYSRRGVDLGAEVRHMTRRQRNQLTVNYLPSDQLFADDRSRVHLTHVSRLPLDFRFAIDAENVSDAFYYEDLGQGPEDTSVPFVERVGRLSYRDENWLLAGELQHFQTIARDLAEADRPYARAPRLIADAEFGVPGAPWLRYGFSSEIVSFDRDFAATGWRLDAAPRLALDLHGGGWFMRPSVEWRYTHYELDDELGNVPEITRSSPTREVPIASFDTGLAFERPSGAGGSRLLTLEPRVQYTYIPFRAQDDLPLFDTGLPDLNPAQIFRANRYVGGDRIGDANQLSVGTTTRLLDSDDGRQFMVATLSQTFYFDTPRVQIPGEVLTTREESDLVAQLGLAGSRNLSADLAVQWNPDETHSERGTIFMQYRPGAESVLNLGYSYQRERLEQIEGSAAWPIGSRWNLFGRYVHSLRDSTALERFAGLEYKACCWRLRALGRRYVSSRTGEQDTGIYLQLELTGLASVGSAADAFLQGSIRGYSRANPTP
jgi:LPS-assembly protein